MFNHHKLREGYNSLKGIGKVFDELPNKHTVEKNLVREYEKFLEKALVDLPDLLNSFNSDDYLSHDNGAHGKYYRVEGIKAHIAVNLGRLKAKIDSSEASPKLSFGEAGTPGQQGGGGSIYINGQVVNITDSAQISADGGSSNTTHGNNSPIILNLGKIENLIYQLETEIEKNYNASDKEEVMKVVNELKLSANEGNESKFKQLGGVLLTRGAEVAQIASLVIQLLALSS